MQIMGGWLGGFTLPLRFLYRTDKLLDLFGYLDIRNRSSLRLSHRACLGLLEYIDR